MYMEPTLYPHLVREPFTKRACTGIHAYEIMYVVVRLCTGLTSRIDTPRGGCEVANQTFRLYIRVNVEFFSSQPSQYLIYYFDILIDMKLLGNVIGIQILFKTLLIFLIFFSHPMSKSNCAEGKLFY